MNKIERIILLVLLVLMAFSSYIDAGIKKKLFKELKDLNSTLEYIDKRMDTLEFYRVPEK